MKCIPLSILLVAAAANVFAGEPDDYNRPKNVDQGVSHTYDPRQKSEMDNLASLQEMAAFTAADKSDAALFVEDREHSIRWSKALPQRWLSNLPGHTGTFHGTAQPGEFYVFQIGVFAAKRDLAALKIDFGDLTGQNDKINSAELRCFNLRGIDHMGQPFTKIVNVPQGELQALWIGVDVPNTSKGDYQGTIKVKDSKGLASLVQLDLKVAGPVLDGHGDRDAWRLSRLRWLDSKIGFDDSVTHPYNPLAIRGQEMKTMAMLGRDLTLDDAGLPTQICSYFTASNTSIDNKPTRSLLTTPFHFIIELPGGKSLALKPDKVQILRQHKGAVEWRAGSHGDGIDLTVDGLIEYDGFAKYRCVIKSDHELQVADIRLEFAVSKEAEYFMGLGQHGGRRPDKLDWKWNSNVNQDGFWIGAVNGGFKIQFFGDNWRAPLINCYYHFRPINVPESWGGAECTSGGIRLSTTANGDMKAVAYSGPRMLKAGQTLNYGFQLFLTPFHTLNTDEQWSLRYQHANNEQYAKPASVKAMGANTINIHQSRLANPVINYPYFDLSMPLLKKVVAESHAAGLKTKIYYTTREITNNLNELFAFWSMNGEIICPSPGKDGVKAHPLTNGGGPHPWLVEHLGETGFIPAWRDVVGGPYHGLLDLAVITTPDSRLDNFYLEGLAFTLSETGIDGLYVDDTALDRKAFQRAHRIFAAAGKPLLADMHSWNHWNPTAGSTPSAYVFMQNFPYYHRIWLGEGFNMNAPLDNLLVEQSGLPFGLMSEMLDHANPWHGMVFGETARLGWSGDPRPLWKFWDDFGMAGTEMIGFWDNACPVKTGKENVPATVYRKQGKTLVALASWPNAKNKGTESVKLSVNWPALGLDPAKVSFYAPKIDGFQQEATFSKVSAIQVTQGKGWLLVLDETPRTVSLPPSTNPLEGLSLKAALTMPFEINVPANTVKTKDMAWKEGVTVAAAHIDPLSDEGQSWGVGLAVGWKDGHYVQVNARTDGRWGIVKNGESLFAGDCDRGKPATLAIKINARSVFLYAKADDSSEWQLLADFPRAQFPQTPATIRIGKIGLTWLPRDFHDPGTTSPCRVDWINQY